MATCVCGHSQRKHQETYKGADGDWCMGTIDKTCGCRKFKAKPKPKVYRSMEELEKEYFPERAGDRLRREDPEAWLKKEAKRIVNEAMKEFRKSMKEAEKALKEGKRKVNAG
jgi:hypothetical protein